MDMHFYIFLMWLVSLVAHSHSSFRRGDELVMSLWYLWIFGVPIYFSGQILMWVVVVL